MLPAIYCRPEFGNGMMPNYAYMSSMFYEGMLRNVSPPWRPYVVSTRHYRAPETHDNLEHLAMMERVLGPLPQHMVFRADRREKYFKRGARLDWPDGAASRESMRAVFKLPTLPNLIMQYVDHSAGDFIELLQGILRYDPTERLKAREALRHPFFTRDVRRGGYPM